jgi:hypothetical protein
MTKIIYGRFGCANLKKKKFGLFIPSYKSHPIGGSSRPRRSD